MSAISISGFAVIILWAFCVVFIPQPKAKTLDKIYIFILFLIGCGVIIIGMS